MGANAIHTTTWLTIILLLFVKQLTENLKIRRPINCKTKNIIYIAYCTKCGKQGVGSTTQWKPRLANYKSHIKRKIKKACSIVKHFMTECNDHQKPHGYLRFILIDYVNNTDDLSAIELDDILLQKEKFWIATLNTYPFGLNSSHDLNRTTRKNIPEN